MLVRADKNSLTYIFSPLVLEPRHEMALKRLEPCAGKLARTVLRRVAVGNSRCLSAPVSIGTPKINLPGLVCMDYRALNLLLNFS